MAETVSVAAISAVPLVGGSLAAIIGGIFQAKQESRIHLWLEDFQRGYEELTDNSTATLIDNLDSNESFFEIVVKAAKAVGETSSHEKHEALRAAVLNSLRPTSPTQDQQYIFLVYITELTSSHMKLLSLLDNPTGFLEAIGETWTEVHMGARINTVNRTFPDWDADFTTQLVRELRTRGLIATENLSGMVSSSGLRQSLTTPYGKQFLAFVTAPQSDEVISN